jgi:tRNA nucleotidyltransferase (CCA-adding enzyme)
MHAAAMSVSAGHAVATGLTGPAVGDWLRKARTTAITQAR